MIAQAILESRSGTSGLSDAPNYNLFGIKGSYNGNSVVLETWEDDGAGNTYTINDAFRQYPSWRASLEDYAQLLQQQIYQGAHRSVAGSYDVATAHLTGRYATDTNYAAKLNNLIVTYNLTRFDSGSAVSPTSSEVSTSGTVWNPHRRSFLLWLFLHHLQFSFESIFAVGAIIGIVQWLGTEIYFRAKLSKGDLCTQQS